MTKNKGFKRIYDGARFCEDCDECPVVDYSEGSGTVKIWDPNKPENGKFKMTKEEWNTLIINSKAI